MKSVDDAVFEQIVETDFLLENNEVDTETGQSILEADSHRL